MVISMVYFIPNLSLTFTDIAKLYVMVNNRKSSKNSRNPWKNAEYSHVVLPDTITSTLSLNHG
jgi:hypothetical protein